jgi:hypothetical protein
MVPGTLGCEAAVVPRKSSPSPNHRFFWAWLDQAANTCFGGALDAERTMGDGTVHVALSFA